MVANSAVGQDASEPYFTYSSSSSLILSRCDERQPCHRCASKGISCSGPRTIFQVAIASHERSRATTPARDTSVLSCARIDEGRKTVTSGRLDQSSTNSLVHCLVSTQPRIDRQDTLESSYTSRLFHEANSVGAVKVSTGKKLHGLSSECQDMKSVLSYIMTGLLTSRLQPWFALIDQHSSPGPLLKAALTAFSLVALAKEEAVQGRTQDLYASARSQYARVLANLRRILSEEPNVSDWQ